MILLESFLAVFAVVWMTFGVWLTVEHAREVRECQEYLRAHRGEDEDRDDHCWAVLHEGQG